MMTDNYLSILWRRRWIVVTVFATFVLVTAVVAKSLDKVYSTTASLVVVQPQDNQSFDTVQAAQVTARTYANILESRNVADLVAARLPGPLSGADLAGMVEGEPVEETQLLDITVENGDPRRARQIANLYATTFAEYVRERLGEVTMTSVVVADRATVPDQPARPRPTLYVLVAALLGAALGLGLAVLRDRFDTRLRSLEDLDAALDVPILARVPKRGTTEESLAAFAEAFRFLRVTLQYADGGRHAKTIAVTSFEPAEGKSTVVTHLANATAAAGVETIVVEADVKRPSQQEQFLPDRPQPVEPGLTTFLAGRAGLAEIIHATDDPGVRLVPVGPWVPSLSNVLDSELGRTLVDDLAHLDSLVLFDCPPLSAGADATTVASHVDGVVLVVDLELATTRGLRTLLRQVRAVKADVIGIVVNRAAGGAHGVYGYGYGSERAAANGTSLRHRVRRSMRV